MGKVLVTGGRGFLGTHLVSLLKEKGNHVRLFARPNADQELNDQEAEQEIIWGDIRDSAAVDRAVDGVDQVVHLVSNFRKGGSDKDEAFDINVVGTRNVFKSALRHGVKRVVHCSTIGVHGNVKEIPASETTAFNPGDLYQETKLIAEKWVWQFHRDTGLPTSVVRPISMFGPGDRRMLKLFKMIKKGRFVVVGDGKALFQPAYIDDVVQGFLLCLEKPESVGEAFIIGGDEYVTLNTLFRMIADELNVKPPKIRVPLKPVLWLAAISEAVCVPLHLEPPLHRRRVSFFQNNRAFSIEKAKKKLGYAPMVSLQEGIRRTIEWYREKGWM